MKKRGRSTLAASAALILAVCAMLGGCDRNFGFGTPEHMSGGAADTDKEPSANNAVSEPDDDSKLYNFGIVNLLTGLPMESAELHNHRPVAVMINNIRQACPQIGLRNADVIYECTVEGGITRLMMLATDYEELGTIGSVRSCREYYLDFAANHDAIYAHIGGSDSAYANLYSREVDYLDGMRVNAFFRDSDRMAKMGYEHSAMTNGELLTAAISDKGFRTEISPERKTSFEFIPYTNEQNATERGNTAVDFTIPYTSAHTPRYEYDAGTNTYKRYQFKGEPHIDGETGEQLTFTNVLIIACQHEDRGDSYNHINVYTTGTGNGYYVSGGKYIPVVWSKSGVDEPMALYTESGEALKMNCGKTFVNIVSDATLSQISFDSEE